MPIKFSFTNEGQDSEYDTPRQQYPIQGQQRREVYAEPLNTARYLQRVKIERVETNDRSVNLSKTMRDGSNNVMLNWVMGLGGAALAWNVVGPMLVFGAKVLFTLVCFGLGYLMFKGGFKPKGDGDDGQA